MIAGAALGATACTDQALERDQSEYEELADSADAALVVGTFVRRYSSPTVPQGLLGTADEFAAAAADVATVGFLPAGCATATSAAGTMTITFADCHGPGVMRGLTGTLHVTYTVSDPMCLECQHTLEAADFGTVGLHANDVDLDITPTAIRVRGPRGWEFDMGGHLETTTDGACSTLGDALWTVDGTYTNDGTHHYISAWGFQRCTGGCPIGNVWRHMSDVAGYVGGPAADPPLRYQGNPSIAVETLAGAFSIDARCD
ncbi:MAG: hypothetical protein K8W52_30520 [Deltaproteobacteria bacterium]|nr:hypothetical protein [Deltaproteobacteria bacterium]